MIIRREQLASLGESRFRDRFRALLKECFEDARSISPDDLNAAISSQLKKAERYGLTSEQPAATYIMSAWLLGSDFDARFPAVGERLADENTSQADKAKWLETFTTTLLDSLEHSGQQS